MAFQFLLKMIIETFHFFQHFGFQFFQLLAVFLDGVRIAQPLPKSFPFFNIALVKDIAAETFHLIRYIPTLVVGNPFVDIIQQPCEDRGGGTEFLNHAVYRIAEHFGIVQFDIQIRAEFQFPRQVTHDGLKERVDGFHPETAVIVQHIAESDSRRFPYFLLRPSGFFFYPVEIGLRIFVTYLNAV